MIAKIKEYFKQRRQARQLAEIERGYDYGAGQLLRGVPVDIVESYAFNPYDNSRAHFDRGIINATKDWDRLMSN